MDTTQLFQKWLAIRDEYKRIAALYYETKNAALNPAMRRLTADLRDLEEQMCATTQTPAKVAQQITA